MAKGLFSKLKQKGSKSKSKAAQKIIHAKIAICKKTPYHGNETVKTAGKNITVSPAVNVKATDETAGEGGNTGSFTISTAGINRQVVVFLAGSIEMGAAKEWQQQVIELFDTLVADEKKAGSICDRQLK